MINVTDSDDMSLTVCKNMWNIGNTLCTRHGMEADIEKKLAFKADMQFCKKKFTVTNTTFILNNQRKKLLIS